MATKNTAERPVFQGFKLYRADRAIIGKHKRTHKNSGAEVVRRALRAYKPKV